MSDNDEKKAAQAPANLPFIGDTEKSEGEKKEIEPVVEKIKSDNKTIEPAPFEKEEVRAQESAPKEQEQNKLEDIFSESKEAEKPAVFQPLEDSKNDDWGISEAEIKEQNRKKLTMLLLIFVVVVLLGVGVYWGFAKIVNMIGQVPEANKESSEQAIIEVEEQEEPVEDEKNKNQKIPEENNENKIDIDQGEEINPEQDLEDEEDSDRDGLSNQEEIERGTNPNKVDSDNDSLFDREEVKVYRTNPLNPDTDGDGFLDGEEVRAGYNPKGEGRLNVIKR